MNITTIKEGVKIVGKTLAKKAPAILTGATVAGTVATVILTTRATIRATELIEERKEMEERDELTKAEVVETVWQEYIPVAISATTTIICAISACSINAKREAALLSAYTLAKDAFKEYKEANVVANGPKAHQKTVSQISERYADRLGGITPSSGIPYTGKGNLLCIDSLTGQPFYSCRDAIEKAMNDLNHQLLHDGTVSLNEWYDMLGIAHCEFGDRFVWDIQDGQMEIEYDSELTPDKTPVLVVNYYDIPRYKYSWKQGGV